MSDRDLTREAVEELAGAAALGALTAEDARRIRAHLAGCPACRSLYAELARTAELLLLAPEPIAPSPELRARVMARIAQTPQGEVDASDGASAGAPPVTALAPRRPGARWSWRELAAIGSLAAAFFFGFWTLRLEADVARLSAQLAQQQPLVGAATAGRVVPIAGTPAAPQVRGALAEGPGGTVVYLELLPRPAPGRAYQVWLIPPGGAPIGVGVTPPGHGGTQSVPLTRGGGGMQTVAITEEPAGGSPSPTTAVLAAGRL